MERKLRYLAVDDEPLALAKIDEYANQVPFLELAGSFKNGLEAITFLTQNSVDLVFMDINMEGLDGFQTIELMHPRPLVVITTAYSKHALKGFDLDVCDYLLKPYSFERFVKSVSRAYEQACSGAIRSTPTGPLKENKDYIFLKTEHHIQRVQLNDILFIKGMGDYLQVHLSNEQIMVLMNFEEMGSLLPSENFLRIHRSYMINLEKLKTIERKHVVINETRIPISQTYKEVFQLYLKRSKLL